MKKFLNKSTRSTIAGYVVAVFNAIIILDVDNLDYNLPSTWLKLFGAIVLPIIGGHVTQMKDGNKINE